MAKMFYSLEEAAQKLGKSADEVRAMGDRRELEVFRDRDRIMFKVEQVDLLARGGDDVIPLASDSGELEPLTLASSGSAAALNVDNKEQTGISIFEADGTDDADPSAVTRITNSPSILSQDPGKSGSGLLDLTREIDETALGVTSLENVYSSSGSADQSAPGVDAGEAAVGGGALFESPAAGADSGMSPLMAAYIEPYDGPGSGLVGGLALGSLVALGCTAFAVLLAITGSSGFLLKMLGENMMIIVGAFAGFTLLAAIVGWLLGRKA
jgi:hypothetical protein